MRITGVGSLPHTDAAAAARFVLATTDVPYLPQLPARHPEEAMLRQWGDGVCGLGAVADGIGLRHGAPPGPRREAFGGAAALLEAGPAPLLKTQVTGPVTLALAALAAGHGRAGLWACLLPALTERVAAHLAWIRRRRPEAGVVVLVDEPGLVAFAPGAPPGPIAPEEAAEALGTFLATIDAPAGIHCCGETDWRLVARLRPDWISWDLERLGAAFAPAADALAAATAAGTRFVWGVVPTRPGVPPDPDLLRERFGAAVARLVVAGAPAEALLAGSWLSPACGLAGLTVAGAELVMATVAGLAATLPTA